MRTSQSFGVHFTIKKEKAKDGVTNVYVAVTINKERIRFALKHYVKVENWDAGHSGLKAKVPEAKETNAYLEQVKFTITTYYQQLQIAGKEATPALLKAMFLGEETEETYSLSKLMYYHYTIALHNVKVGDTISYAGKTDPELYSGWFQMVPNPYYGSHAEIIKNSTV